MRGIREASISMPASKNAKYAVVAKDLIEAINSRKYPVGTLLPTEAELCETYSVSRQTVREALRQLTIMGLVVRQTGIGSRVRRQHTSSRYTHSVDSLFGLEDYARTLRLVVDTIDMVTATGPLAALIGCRVGSQWLRVCGRRYPEGSDTPVAFSETYIHSGFPDLKNRMASLESSTIHAMLEREYGETVEEVQQQMRGILLDAGIARALHAQEGSAGLEIRRRFFGKGHRLLLSGRVVHLGPHFSYDSHFIREAA